MDSSLYSKTHIQPQSLSGRGGIHVLRRQGLGIQKTVLLFFYYTIAIRLPDTPMPFCGLSGRIRSALARRLFKKCGKRVIINSGAVFGTGHLLEIGDDSAINRDCWIANDTLMGDDVMMGPKVTILSSSHEFSDTSKPMREQGAPPRRPVIIGDDVWIGTQAIILPGVHIGGHSIIGAGSVVTNDVDPWSIVAGNPARLIRSRLQAEKGESQDHGRGCL
jgi:maltose O-acetyltransferase